MPIRINYSRHDEAGGEMFLEMFRRRTKMNVEFFKYFPTNISWRFHVQTHLNAFMRVDTRVNRS